MFIAKCNYGLKLLRLISHNGLFNYFGATLYFCIEYLSIRVGLSRVRVVRARRDDS